MYVTLKLIRRTSLQATCVVDKHPPRTTPNDFQTLLDDICYRSKDIEGTDRRTDHSHKAAPLLNHIKHITMLLNNVTLESLQKRYITLM
jgi:hypothetical protein